MSPARWLPLESNPEVMNKYISSLGVADTTWQYYDVYGLDPDLLMMLPQPVSALLLLFPITDNYKAFCETEHERLQREPQTVSDAVYFTKQTVGNACGTVGIIHSIANNPAVNVGGALSAFLTRTKNMSAEDRAKALEDDPMIAQCHSASAAEGQTAAVDEDVALHFVALVHVDGCLYELDGRKPFPINHGATDANRFLSDAAGVCKKFMERDPDVLQFNIIALAKDN